MTGYQFGTSPRKIESNNVNKNKTKVNKKLNKSKKINNKKAFLSKEAKTRKKEFDYEKKTKIIEERKLRFSIGIKIVLIITLLFLSILQGSKMRENFSKIQTLKTQMASIQKENDQLKINIQNSLNLNNIEQSAKELLGMQKLTNKQTVHITLSKKDYIEYKTEEVVIEENTENIFVKMINKIKSIFS